MNGEAEQWLEKIAELLRDLLKEVRELKEEVAALPRELGS